VSNAPRLETPRLVLRAFVPSDTAAVQRLAGAIEVARTTLRIPHPYETDAAPAWIALHPDKWKSGTEAHFAAVRKDEGDLIGAIGLMRTEANPRIAELGYWIGYPYWNNGYCTEAAARVLAYGFAEFSVDKIVAHHFADNPASGRVLTKIGLRHEGVLPRHVERWGEKKDLVLYGLTRDDFNSI